MNGLFILLIVGLVQAEPVVTSHVVPSQEACQVAAAVTLNELHKEGFKDVAVACLPFPELGQPA